MNAIRLSVVTATFNRRHVLERTLPAFLAHDMPPEDYELIYAVDGSGDGTAEMLRALHPRCALRVIELPHRGAGAARNAGISAASGDIVLFLDDDLICPPDLFRKHLSAHTDPEPALVQGPMSLAPESRASVIKDAHQAWSKQYYARLLSQLGAKWPEEAQLVSNSSVPRAVLIACGGFDERFLAQEDYELGLRLRKMGVRFKFLPDAPARELYAKSSRYFLHGDGDLYGKTALMLCRKHPEYRPRSILAGLGETVWWKRLPRQVILRFPVSAARLFTAPIWICDQLCRFPAMHKLGVRLLAYGRRIVELRSAAREAGSLQALDAEFRMDLPVLLYHHIGPSRPRTFPEWTVSAERFESHVRWLSRRGHTGICPSDWMRWLREGKGLPRKPVLLTFDDGFADLAEYALPVLRRYGFGAGVFIVTGQVGGTNAWDEARGSGTHRILTCEQIRYWATQQIEFGAHTRTHADLTTLSPPELSAEVTGSAKDLEYILGVRPRTFAYPYGLYNHVVEECVRESFDMAFLGDGAESLNNLSTDPFKMRRIVVKTSDSALDVECRVRWGFNPLERLRARLRLRSRLRSLWGR